MQTEIEKFEKLLLLIGYVNIAYKKNYKLLYYGYYEYYNIHTITYSIIKMYEVNNGVIDIHYSCNKEIYHFTVDNINEGFSFLKKVFKHVLRKKKLDNLFNK